MGMSFYHIEKPGLNRTSISRSNANLVMSKSFPNHFSSISFVRPLNLPVRKKTMLILRLLKFMKSFPIWNSWKNVYATTCKHIMKLFVVHQWIWSSLKMLSPILSRFLESSEHHRVTLYSSVLVVLVNSLSPRY